MKISLAKNSGFCMGVRNAVLRIVNEINKADENIFIYGPLIHNPQTISILDRRGLKTVKSFDNIAKKQVAIRTHGIPIEEYRLIKSRASSIINLTCPRVANVQSIIKKYSKNGYFIIIIGDKNHAEVQSLQSYAENGSYTLLNKSEISGLPGADKYALVCQTTLDEKLFHEIVAALKRKIKNLEVINTICDSTRFRQQDVLEGIKNGIDTLIVIGGKNSSNTRSLAGIGTENKVKTYHIETEDELSSELFRDSSNVLVTAGASTPGWIINNVLEKLYFIKSNKSNIFFKLFRSLLEFSIRTNLLSALSAFFYSLLVLNFFNIKNDFTLPVITSLYIFSMYSINNCFEKNFLKDSNPYKYRIYNKYGAFLFSLSICSLVTSLILSLRYNATTVIILLFSCILGFIYSTNPVKFTIKSLKLKFIKLLYNSKIIAGFGWIIIAVLLPVFNYPVEHIHILPPAVLIFILLTIRTMLLDIIAFQGDLILGRESLPISIGLKNMDWLIVILALGGIILYSGLLIHTGSYKYLILNINILYFLIILYSIRFADYIIYFKYELFIDLNNLLFILLYFALQY